MSKYLSYENKIQKLNLDDCENNVINSFHNVSYPCDLGIVFFCNGNRSLFEELLFEINVIYKSYFFEIKEIKVENNLFFSEDKRKRVKFRAESKEIFLFPTNQFYEKILKLRIMNDFNIGVGITDLPIYSSSNDNLVFLYGEAHLWHNCAIISSYNLKSEPISSQEYNNVIQNRIIKEVIHEIGHIILGLVHCVNNYCVMSYSKNLRDVDKKSFYLCNDCRVKLKTIKISSNL
ncbi:MAG: hypothetical protein ACFE8E_14045 [Candidatus Hodarchaeota archaeon]